METDLKEHRMKKHLDSKIRKKRMPAKKKAEGKKEVYILTGKVVACVNGKTYEVKAD